MRTLTQIVVRPLRVNEKNFSTHCSRVSHFGTFLCRPCQDTDVKWWNFRFCGRRDHSTTIFQLYFRSAKFPHSPIPHYTCRLLLTENNGKNNVIAVGLCAVFVVSWWRNKRLHILNRMHNEVWGCAEIALRSFQFNSWAVRFETHFKRETS